MAKEYILSIDQGTTSTTAILIDRDLNIVSKSQKELHQIYPQPGWVEHSPDEIWNTTLSAIDEAIKSAEISPFQIAGIGITNQRETSIIWERHSGKPLFNAIVWQCRRTSKICEELKEKGLEDKFKEKTGLVIDPYFSGTKIKWLLQNVDGIDHVVKKKNLCFGTVDSYLLFRLTGGSVHASDFSNASRTLIFNISDLQWDDELLQILGIPENILPRVIPSSFLAGKTKNVPVLPDGISISGIAGDQQAALFGQCCFNEGDSKCTYGTGAFLLVNTEKRKINSSKGLITSIGWALGEDVKYCLEGSVFIAGAAVQWLRDGLGIIKSASEIEELAKSVKDSGGVIFVPALSGLGSPYWKKEARGAFFGISRATTKAHISRATLEGIAMQIYFIIKGFEEDLGYKFNDIRVDGGATQNNLLMQIQADILGIPVIRPSITETTALGAAFLAGLGVSFWNDTEEIKKSLKTDKIFYPSVSRESASEFICKFQRAIEKTITF